MTIYDILCSENVIETINENLEYLLNLIPEIKYMMGFEHKHPHHHLDVWNHTLLAVSLSENNFDIRLILLLHDIGKPFCYQEKDGIRHFKGHQSKSAEIAFTILKRMNFNDEYIKKICFYILNHDHPINNQLICSDIEIAINLYKIQKCDALAHNPNKLEKRKEYIEKIEKKLQLLRK